MAREQSGGTLDMSALGANTVVQPIACYQRDAGTESNVLTVDYWKWSAAR